MLKKGLLFLFCVMLFANNFCRAQLPMFDQTHVNKIYVTIPQDTLQTLINDGSGKYYMASFFYTNGIDTLGQDTVGFRIRGNTSLVSQKKSFKISFNTFDTTKKYNGLHKLNLIGNHNDPTCIREKLFYECWEKAGLPKRNTSFVTLYINNIYYGIYTNNEEIDKIWLQKAYGNNDGNLYKCSFGADLVYLTSSQNSYKNKMSNGVRTYELQTNEALDDYQDFVDLVTAINTNYSSTYVSNLEQHFNVNEYLRILALDVATGNWDSYSWNKNNFLLYHDLNSNKFRFFTFDTDNTFGVDWSGIDWTTRNVTKWYHDTQARPLASQLFKDANAKNYFLQQLSIITAQITNPDSIFGRIDQMQNLIIPYIASDSFRTLDYGYNLNSFIKGFFDQVDNHTPYGIKPFLTRRINSIVPLFVNDVLITEPVSVYPNPISNNQFSIQVASNMLGSDLEILNMHGQVIQTEKINSLETKVHLNTIPNGYYLAILKNNKQLIAKIKIEVKN